MIPKLYKFLGAAELINCEAPQGNRVRSLNKLAEFLEETSDRRFTFVVDEQECLLLAPQRSEHVNCSGGQPVLAAGEIEFDGLEVVEVTNQSTGYCPEPEDTWDVLVGVFARMGIPHPPGLTMAFRFRNCQTCGLQLLKYGRECNWCGQTLPKEWNCDEAH